MGVISKTIFLVLYLSNNIVPCVFQEVILTLVNINILQQFKWMIPDGVAGFILV